MKLNVLNVGHTKQDEKGRWGKQAGTLEMQGMSGWTARTFQVGSPQLTVSFPSTHLFFFMYRQQ